MKFVVIIVNNDCANNGNDVTIVMSAVVVDCSHDSDVVDNGNICMCNR